VNETGIFTAEKSAHITARRTKIDRAAISWEGVKDITVVGLVSACGNSAPQTLIYPRRRMSPQLHWNGPAGALHTCSKPGGLQKNCIRMAS
jgi:hypothetical protein